MLQIKYVFGTFALFPHSWKYDETGNGNILPNLLNLLTNILLWKSIYFLKLFILKQKETKKKENISYIGLMK